MAQKRVDFSYNAAGQFTQLKRYEDLTATNLVAQTDYAYDGIGRLTALDHVQGGTGLNAYDYTFDAASRITSVTSTADGLTSYSYDDTNQLTSADNASPRADETYSYDDNGNRSMSGYTTGDNNQTTSDGTYNYEYDHEGNMTKKTAISGGAYEVYTWDHRNRLTNVTFKNSSHVVQKTVDYTYDLYNRMVRRTYDSDGPGGSAAVDQFFSNDGYEIALEFDASAATDVSHRYLWGSLVDQILADEQVTTTSSAGNVIHPLTDNLGTTRDLADHNTGTHVTSVTNHRTYNGFGVRTAESNSAVDLLFGFTSKPYDEVTKTQYNVFRIYFASFGQWMSEDPIEFDAGDSNLRRYVFNGVTHYLDPFGREISGSDIIETEMFGGPLDGEKDKEFWDGAWAGLEGRARVYSPLYGFGTAFYEEGVFGAGKHYLNTYFLPGIVCNQAKGYYNAWGSSDGIVYHHFTHNSALAPVLKGMDAYEKGDAYAGGKVLSETIADAGAMASIAVGPKVIAKGSSLPRTGPAPTKGPLPKGAPEAPQSLPAIPATNELAQEILKAGKFKPGQQVVTILETANGPTIAAGGAADLNAFQKAFAESRGLVVANDIPGAHAELTGIAMAGEMGLLPTRGVATAKVCSTGPANCVEQMNGWLRGSKYRLQLSRDRRAFEFIEIEGK